jgi:hypothetical protein
MQFHPKRNLCPIHRDFNQLQTFGRQLRSSSVGELYNSGQLRAKFVAPGSCTGVFDSEASCFGIDRVPYKEMENMKRSASLIFVLLLFAPSLSATPLIWDFMGTTTAGSRYMGNPIAVGSSFELQVSLDTDLVGMKPGGLSDVFFTAPAPGFAGEIEIPAVGSAPLPLTPFPQVANFAPSQVTGVELLQPAFNQVLFSSPISSDILHLTPISPVTPDPRFNHLSLLMGPNGLVVFGTVDTFSAVETTPENSTATMLIWVFIAVGALRLARRLALVRALTPQMHAHHRLGDGGPSPKA